VQEHTILKEAAPSDNDDDEDMLEPSATGASIRRVACYHPHLQRIHDRHPYDYDTTNNNADNSATNTSIGQFVIEVPLDELVAWDAVRGSDLAERATNNTVRYAELFGTVMDTLLSAMTTTNNSVIATDVIDILHQQRIAQQQLQQNNAIAAEQQINNNNIYAGAGQIEQDEARNNTNNNTLGATEELPAVLMRRYELRILPRGRPGTLPPFTHQYHGTKQLAILEGVSLRSVRSQSMGRLVTMRGMIVRASDVKPACVVATYSCDACGAEVYQLVQNKREFMPQRFCPSNACSKRKSESLYLQTRGSKFVKFQELKLQELPNQVPMGHIPRSMSVYCRGELTRVAFPGDVITVDGVFLPQRLAEGGFIAMKAGLITTTYVEAQNIVVHKKSYDESMMDSLSEDESAKLEAGIVAIATGEDPIGKLSSSIAPEIFGHEDIKRALLLQLVGGCTRALPDGMRIRGDINICLMGDPGVAKSQLLKQIASIAPRGVYTTGKGSSGVGLTAAVTRDQATGEMSLEGGALVLADRGICCIDEFDKMDESDRTAIHEVMEQQTVSIAKAGIVATLNARAAVLAAANPLYGRYNRSKSLSENVNLPNSLLSRFDLLFLVLDIADVDKDMALARHVTFVHQNEGVSHKKSDDDVSVSSERGVADEPSDTISPRVLREYISRARKHQPVMPPDVAPYVVEAYVSLRMQERPGKNSQQNDQTVMTARQLLSILRLSQALARLRFSDFVAREDVDEAIRLTHMSKASLLDEDKDGGDVRMHRRGEDVMSRIFNIIRDYSAVCGSTEVELKLCEAMVLRKGFTAQQLQSCLDEYETLRVIKVNESRTHVYFL
jgi:DNA replication licensing factor MCM7